MAAAEDSLETQEPQAAESHYRSALQEGWLLLGGLEAAEGDLARAKAAFERAAVSAADLRQAHLSLALVELKLGNEAEAVRLLRGVVVRNPDDRGARRLLAQALIAAGSPDEAVQELEEMLASTGDGDPETAFALGTGYLRLGKVAKADELFARIARQLPGAQTQVLIGRTYRDFRLFEHARSALDKALEIDPEVRRGHYYLGTLALLSRGRDGLEAAIEEFGRELEIAPKDPMTHLYLGMALVEERRFEEAMASLEIAAGWEPTRLDALRFSGRCQLAFDRPAAAVAVLDQALELAETTSARARQLSGIHYQLATALRRQGSEGEALRHFDAAREVSTRLVEGERDRFTRFLSDGAELESEGRAFQPPVAPRVARLDAGERRELRRRVVTALARAYLNLGILQARRGRFPRAVPLFESAAELDPDFPRLQYSLGAALFRAQRFSAAVGPLEKALSEDPSDPDLRRMLAVALLNGEDYDRAATLLRDDPRRETEPSLAYAYGLALVRSGRAQEAGKLFSRLISEHADWPELHVLLGQAHAHEGDFDAAIEALKRALQLDEAVADASATLGILYLKQGRLAEAETALRAELQHHPEDVSARYHLAVVLDLNQRSDEASEELRAVLRARPQFADARYLLGKIRLAQGAEEEAALHLEAAAALAPEDANIHYQLAQAYQRQGEADKAGRQLEIYRDLKRRERSDEP